MKCAIVLFCILIVNLAWADPIKLKDGDRVAFVGGTFTEREAEFSTIETYLTLSNPNKNIIFRNYGWAADTVKGESRGYFKIKEGYNNLLNQVSDISPNVIILSYGANAAWNGKDGLDQFLKDYEKLINDLSKQNKARVILVSTPQQENLGGDYPNPQVYNKNLALYFSAIEELATKNNLEYHDLFKEVNDIAGLTSNS
ncbi:MAG: GDSL-type esterase/lipase family protein, partial [Lentisphaeraceae bacterium]|nr:GDSL-type esterase/lipase family protein [Lentisphaeraceae bacterium]